RPPESGHEERTEEGGRRPGSVGQSAGRPDAVGVPRKAVPGRQPPAIAAQGVVPAPPESRPARVRRPTATAAFGSTRRESHDASGFYRRFVSPEVSSDENVRRPKRVDVVYKRDARDMRNVEPNSVALVVTSPPYFAGKEYEESLGQN